MARNESVVSTEALHQLEAKLHEKLRANKAKQEAIYKMIENYKALDEVLSTLPDKKRYSIMVPFSSKAFMEGELVHTNELLVLLGDNYFVEQTARETRGILQRRIEYLKTKLRETTEVSAGIQSRHALSRELQSITEEYEKEGIVEIREEYNEEEETARASQAANTVAERKRSPSLDKEFDRLFSRLSELEVAEEQAMDSEEEMEYNQEETGVMIEEEQEEPEKATLSQAEVAHNAPPPIARASGDVASQRKAVAPPMNTERTFGTDVIAPIITSAPKQSVPNEEPVTESKPKVSRFRASRQK